MTFAPTVASSGSASNRPRKVSAVPTGMRTFIESFGGVMPRRMCGFRSWITATVVPDAAAIAASGTRGPTRIESYANGGSESNDTA